MSQRGGSVVTYVKYGEKVNSPIIDKGEADVVLAFERLEGLRALPFLKKNGKIIINDSAISPMPVIIGAEKYPDGILEELSSKAEVTAVDALKLSIEAGSPKAVNVVLIGVLAKQSGIDKEIWLKVLKSTVPPKFLDLNIIAFEKGYNH
jgi:indolepyruvate ferredoxin oxidoreductase beta subunit